MRQQSFATDDFEKYRKKTRKEVFLEEMDRIIPWKALSKVIKPYYPKPKSGAEGRSGDVSAQPLQQPLAFQIPGQTVRDGR